MSRVSCPPLPGQGGFTLIEVMAALMIFIVGVLMVLRLSAAATNQMEYSRATSELMVIVHELIDSLQATPFDSLEAKSEEDVVEFGGIKYVKTLRVSLTSPLLYTIYADVSPEAPPGPHYSVTTYVAGVW